MCHIFTWNLFSSFWTLFEVQFSSAANLMDHPDHVNGKYLPKLKMIQVLVMDFQFILNIFNMRNIKLYLTRFYISWWLVISDESLMTQFAFTDSLQAWKKKLAVWLVSWRVWYSASFPCKFFRKRMKFASSNVLNQNWAQIIEF